MTLQADSNTEASWALRQTNDGAADPSTVLCDEHKDLKAAAMANAGPNTDIHEWMRVPKNRYGCIICIYDQTGESPKAKVTPHVEKKSGDPWAKVQPEAAAAGYKPPANSDFWMMSDEDTLEVRAWLSSFMAQRNLELPGTTEEQLRALTKMAWQVGLKIEDGINGVEQYKFGTNSPSQYGGGAGGRQYTPNGYGGYNGYGGSSYTPYVPPKKKDARDDAFAAFKGSDDAEAEITFDTPEDVEDEVVSETPLETILADHAAGEHDTADPECPLCDGVDPSTGEVE